MKIAFFEIQNWEKTILKKKLKNHSLQFFSEPINESFLPKIKDIDLLSVFIYSKLDDKILKKLPKLKIIITRSTGFDHISLPACKKRKIKVCNRPSYGDNTVAEHTFALILALSRKTHKAYLRAQKDDFTIKGLQGFDLENKTLGVIGTGKIGKHVIRIARGFGMKVLAYDKFPDSSLANELNFNYAPLTQLLKKSDIITLHIPLLKQTKYLINSSRLKQMKSSAILINTSRGEIVDTTALLNALDNKKIAGAGLDVIEGEVLIKEEKELLHKKTNPEAWKQIIENHAIIDNENVVFTPHIAFYSKEALHRIIENTIQNIKDFDKNKLNKEYIVC